MLGASTGTSMKVMNTRLITRAMASASNRSRTIATTSTRVTAADAPIATRPAINSGKLAGEPAQQCESAVQADPCREHRLAAEPVGERSPESCVEAKPRKYAMTTSCWSFSCATCSDRPMSASAGIIASMANALSAIRPASITVISRVPGRCAPS